MITWEYSNELKEVCDNNNIKLIDPLSLFPDSSDNTEAFNRLLTELVEQTHMFKFKMGSLFRSSTPETERIVNKFEIEGLIRIIDEKNFEDSCGKFRALMDQSTIPKDFEAIVVDIFKKLAIKCSNSAESESLNNAGFNLFLSDLKYRFQALSYLMVTANVRNGPLDFFHPTIGGIGGINEEGYIIAIPDAIRCVIDLGQPITDAFRINISSWVERSTDIEKFDPEGQLLIKKWIDKAWEGPTTYEHPLKRKKRLREINSSFKTKTAHEIYSNMIDRMPKTINKPFEE